MPEGMCVLPMWRISLLCRSGIVRDVKNRSRRELLTPTYNIMCLIISLIWRRNLISSADQDDNLIVTCFFGVTLYMATRACLAAMISCRCNSRSNGRRGLMVLEELLLSSEHLHRRCTSRRQYLKWHPPPSTAWLDSSISTAVAPIHASALVPSST